MCTMLKAALFLIAVVEDAERLSSRHCTKLKSISKQAIPKLMFLPMTKFTFLKVGQSKHEQMFWL